ncbi:disintegrin and metalloproteinase domain-containing protein 19 [Papilio machaon]|uniref:disintegrin and metalloproteinase domain-containing protein 19 n=1 Tax=Papilio machaon TaxID=76193 RepID=UPI001E66333A|nr:disintegrin and metalloproteinase domain-containing protein 19 [Papilio machaon]
MFKCDILRVWCLFLVNFLLLIALTKDTVIAQELKSPAPEFRRHRLVRPAVHHGRTKREITTTRDDTGAHHPEVTVKLDIDGEEHLLDLRLNEDLVTDNHVLSYQKNGETVLHKPKKEELDLCQYSGKVRGKDSSWVAVSTCHGVRGVVYDGTRMRYIEPAEGGEFNSQHYIYDHSDLQAVHRCGYEGGVTNNTQYDPQLMDKHNTRRSIEQSRINRYKRETYDDTEVRGPFNANKQSRYVELVLVADNREYKANGENLQTVHRQLKDVANIINSVYAPLNIFIALVGVVVWSERDEIQLEENGDRTLTNFLVYRRMRLLSQIPNDNAHLLTRQKFQEGVVGKALKGPICTFEFSGGVATNHSEVIGLVATTIAHEMGHNFGMEHDTEEDCECPDEKCIMSPSSTSVMPIHWSSCSLRSLALSFERGMDYCLRNKPRRLFESPTCGNGFVEIGEQCDCGIGQEPSRAACVACCDPNTCMLRNNASCAAGECCDLNTCRPKSAGTVCRSADRECDLPEYCSGHSEYCPRDVHRMDTTPCGNGQAYCVRGACRSHTDQCRLLWGSTGESSDTRCYTSTNIKGTKNGNCGYDRIRQIFRPCSPADARCGLLQCRHLNERLEFGMESVAQLSALFINNNGTIIPCRTAIIDLGLSDVDPGMVPDGAKCGDDKMCLNQRCVNVEAVRAAIAKKETAVCPTNCSGHGVCNSEGHCHCDAGFAPPLCALPGPGGSYDSGPATDSSIQRNFMVAMYVIFLGILPSILLLLFLIYYSRQNVLWWKKPRKTVQSPKKTSLQRRLSRGASKFAANFQNGGQNNPQPVSVHTLSNPDDMSSSLLRADAERSPNGNLNPTVNFFGNFKGFSLTPIDKNQPQTDKTEPPPVKEKTKTETVAAKSAKITPVHRSGSNSQNLINQSVLKPVLRSAPPLPVVPTANTSPKTSPSIKRTNSSVQNRIKALMNTEKTEDVPSTANPAPRPVISSPILEASTCTAKELISPLQGSKTLGPIRAAPTVPGIAADLKPRPVSMHSGAVPQKPLPEEPKKVKEGISLNRIASFLKQEKPKEKERHPVERSHSLPKNPNHQVKGPKSVDKVALRNLQISNPIVQKQIDLPVSTIPVVSDTEDPDDGKSFVNRAQSMRAPTSQKPQLQSFGSMRQPAPRPLSVAGRPTAPPPPLPHPTHPSQPSQPAHTDTSIYQNPKALEIKSVDYVDCIEEKSAPLAHIDEESGDNIYAIIEESPEKHSKPLPGVPPPVKTIPQPPPVGYNTPKPVTSTSGSTESVGLLGEIVNEIQNRNFDSIYSASTLSRKKEKERKEKNAENKRDSTYMNADHYKTPESVYSNSGAKSSSASTTSSGYLHPSAVNVPTYMKEKDNNNETKETDRAPPSPTLKVNSKIPTFSRQVTPPGLKNTTTFKNVPQSPKNTIKNANITPKIIPNSPDLVSSCAMVDTKNVKAPDVINNNKILNEPPKVAAKPTVPVKNADNRPPLKPAPTIDKKTTNKTQVKTNPSTNVSKTIDKPNINRVQSKIDSNVKAIADNLNKNKPKVVPKPSTINVQRTESNVKTNPTKLSSKPSNVASLQQKFENRKSLGKEINVPKK